MLGRERVFADIGHIQDKNFLMLRHDENALSIGREMHVGNFVGELLLLNFLARR